MDENKTKEKKVSDPAQAATEFEAQRRLLIARKNMIIAYLKSRPSFILWRLFCKIEKRSKIIMDTSFAIYLEKSARLTDRKKDVKAWEIICEKVEKGEI